MNKILSIDPGHTTGIAAFDEAGNLNFAMTVPKEFIYRKGFMESLTKLAKPDVVLVEKTPDRMADHLTEHIWVYFRMWYKVAGYDVVDISPSQWKGLVERVEIPGQHARDAASMAKWYMRAREGK